MADIHLKLPENTPGPYFVDRSCIDCDTCRGIGATNFRRDAEHGRSSVCKQPDGEAELEAVEEAMERCPAGAIGRSEQEPALR